ncbi:MAG: class I SAM-dependent methyltransferase [Planctomycetes bacterium]|nr:class I SAM-dependent methyltransferase [Planctomycetota bacterium]
MSSAADQARWNRKYGDPAFRSGHAPNPRLAAAARALPPGRALELACGLGDNAALVAAAGHRVVGVDVSEVGLARARAAHPELLLIQADALRLPLAPGGWDFVICTYYLERALFPWLRAAVRPGGALFFETFTEAEHRRRPDFPVGFCLGTGELRAAFADWELLAWAEEADPALAYASLFARRPRK